MVLRSASVNPHTGVTSEPAYVVGTATIGNPLVNAMALAVPVVDPPPTLNTASARVAAASARACSATRTGTCGRTWLNVAAIRSANGATSRSASGRSASPATSNTRDAPSRSISPASRVRAAPAANTTRPGNPS